MDKICISVLAFAAMALATGQVNDKFIYNNTEYSVSAIEYPETFFDIYSFGIKPKMFSTANYRGYKATFAINNSKLVLDKLHTNNGNKIENEAPLINNKLPKISNPKGLVEEYKNSWREFIYEDIDLIIHYTGSIIITKDFIRGRYVHMGFQSPVNYNVVIQLTFNDGQLVSSNDLSSVAASIREDKIELAEKNISKEQWINDCFNISYLKKAKELIKK
jgi:hypothetical protein